MRKVLQALAVIGGMSASVLGSVMGLLYAALPWLGLEAGLDRLQGFVLGGAFVALGLGLGLPLAWTALQSWGGKSSPALRWPRFWLLGLLFLLVVIIGQVMLSSAPLPWLFFPPFYILSIALPTAAVLSLVGRRLADGDLVIRWREVLAQLGSGAFLGTTAAFMLEAILLIALALVAVMIIALTPGGIERLQTLLSGFRSPEGFPDPDLWLALLRSPWMIALVLFGMAVAAPAIEEAVKALGVLLMSYRRPSRTRAFLWGVAGGAGFALAEGLLNSVLVLAEPRLWAWPILARAGTAVSHCLGGGLMGLGWQTLLGGRRRWRVLGYYALAVALHGLWNALAGGMALIRLLTLEGATDEATMGLGNLGMILAATMLGGLLVAELLLLVYLSRRLAGNRGNSGELSSQDHP